MCSEYFYTVIPTRDLKKFSLEKRIEEIKNLMDLLEMKYVIRSGPCYADSFKHFLVQRYYLILYCKTDETGEKQRIINFVEEYRVHKQHAAYLVASSIEQFVLPKP
jgi:hypothetical protein